MLFRFWVFPDCTFLDISTSDRFARIGNLAWPGGRTANFAAFGSWPGVLPKNAESLRNSDALMRVAVPRRRGPAGLRGLFSFLTKLRLVRPIPETSFSSPDAPACAVPAQAAFPLALSRLGAVQGFSVLSLCLTPFLDFGDKKKAVNYSHSATSQRSDFRCSFFVFSSANWNLYNYSSNFPHFIGFPACPLVK